jgi:hypothetical protein
MANQRELTDLEKLVKQFIIQHPGLMREDIILEFYDPIRDTSSRHEEVANAVIYVENRFCITDLPRCTIRYVGGD